MNTPAVISRFLRVGGSSWELKIDPKRVQERHKIDFEEDRSRRGEKKDNKNDQARPKRADKVASSMVGSLFGLIWRPPGVPLEYAFGDLNFNRIYDTLMIIMILINIIGLI